MINEFGGWPVAKGDAWDESLSWQKILEKAIRSGLTVEFPLTISTEPHSMKNSSEIILKVLKSFSSFKLDSIEEIIPAEFSRTATVKKTLH